MTVAERWVLRFDETSEWPKQFVALDQASGGYPYATKDILHAKHWLDAESALAYAEHFPPNRGSYKHYAIEQVGYLMRVTVEE